MIHTDSHDSHSTVKSSIAHSIFDRSSDHFLYFSSTFLATRTMFPRIGDREVHVSFHFDRSTSLRTINAPSTFRVRDCVKSGRRRFDVISVIRPEIAVDAPSGRIRTGLQPAAHSTMLPRAADGSLIGSLARPGLSRNLERVAPIAPISSNPSRRDFVTYPSASEAHEQQSWSNIERENIHSRRLSYFTEPQRCSLTRQIIGKVLEAMPFQVATDALTNKNLYLHIAPFFHRLW